MDVCQYELDFQTSTIKDLCSNICVCGMVIVAGLTDFLVCLFVSNESYLVTVAFTGTC